MIVVNDFSKIVEGEGVSMSERGWHHDKDLQKGAMCPMVTLSIAISVTFQIELLVIYSMVKCIFHVDVDGKFVDFTYIYF